MEREADEADVATMIRANLQSDALRLSGKEAGRHMDGESHRP